MEVDNDDVENDIDDLTNKTDKLSDVLDDDIGRVGRLVQCTYDRLKVCTHAPFFNFVLLFLFFFQAVNIKI